MSTVINLSKIEKEVKAKSPEIFDSRFKEHFLISFMIPLNSLAVQDSHNIRETLQESPVITCDINFKIIKDLHLKAKIKFSELSSLQQLAVTLYYINSKYEIELSERIDVTILKHVTTHFFKHSYACLKNPYRHPINGVFINKNLLIFCKIVKIDSSSKEVRPERETCTQLSSIYKQKLFTDFKIICKNQEFPVHKAIIANASPVFQKMIQVPMKESRENQVHLNSFEPRIIELMIHYMYFPEEFEKALSQETLDGLLKVAHVYEMEDLKKLCFKKICESAKNFSEIVDVFLLAGPLFKEEIMKTLKDVQPKLF